MNSEREIIKTKYDLLTSWKMSSLATTHIFFLALAYAYIYHVNNLPLLYIFSYY